MQFMEVKWNEDFNTGVKVLDDAHKQLFAIVRKLVDLSSSDDKRRWACEEGIKFLKGYALRHFAEEEEYMRSIDYPRYDLHFRIHETMRTKTLPAIEKELIDTDFSQDAIQHLVGISLGWLTAHILSEDMLIAGRIGRIHWSEQQNVEIITRIENAVCKVVKDILGTDLTPISEQYAGEGMGNSVGYQLTCVSKDSHKFRISMLFEESMLLQTVGRMLDMRFSHVDKLVLSAAHELAVIMLYQIGGCFRGLSNFDIKTDNPISAEMLRSQFERRFPTFSLLFDSGEGHMAFCVDVLTPIELLYK